MNALYKNGTCSANNRQSWQKLSFDWPVCIPGQNLENVVVRNICAEEEEEEEEDVTLAVFGIAY